jgi:hypothetical protein
VSEYTYDEAPEETPLQIDDPAAQDCAQPDCYEDAVATEPSAPPPPPPAEDMLVQSTPVEQATDGMPSDVQAVPLPIEKAPQTPVQSPADEPLTFTGDTSCWCSPGTPEEWEKWSPPAEPADESFTEDGYSTDWGTVEPEWAANGEDLASVTQIEEPLSSLVGPGQELRRPGTDELLRHLQREVDPHRDVRLRRRRPGDGRALRRERLAGLRER